MSSQFDVTNTITTLNQFVFHQRFQNYIKNFCKMESFNVNINQEPLYDMQISKKKPSQ